MKAKDIYESGKHSLYISRVEQRIQSYRDGTFTEMENHHAPYPDDFPDPKNLPEATEENTFLCGGIITHAQSDVPIMSIL